jgi:Putative peptidoglycan binding domain
MNRLLAETLGSIVREGFPLRKQHRAKFGLGACAVFFLCSIFPVTLRAQSAASDQSPPAKKKATGTNAATSASAAKTHASSTAKTSSTHAAAAKRTSTASHHSASSHAASTHSKSSASSLSARSHRSQIGIGGKRSGKKVVRGQQKIEPERAQAIQEALIREHYLSGDPAGTWNQQTEDAMRRYQADHGWQSKEVPDSRALISLGLGPSHDHLLNPESAMTTGPAISRAAPPTSAAHSDPVSHGPEPASSQSGSPESRSSGTMTPALPGDPPPAASSDHNACGPQ